MIRCVGVFHLRVGQVAVGVLDQQGQLEAEGLSRKAMAALGSR
jgi:hypothetical protein